MAGRFLKILVAFSFPTIFTILSIYWFKRKKKLQESLLNSTIIQEEQLPLNSIADQNSKLVGDKIGNSESSDSYSHSRTSDMHTINGDISQGSKLVNKQIMEENSNLISEGFSPDLHKDDFDSQNLLVDKFPLEKAQDKIKEKMKKIEETCTNQIENSIKEFKSFDNQNEAVLNTSVDNRNSPPSSNFSDFHSEGSCDSGKGGSDIQGSNSISESNNNIESDETLIIYQFELPFGHCGRLIGRNGFYVQLIKEKTNARVIVNKHPISTYVKLCTIEGVRSEVRNALKMVRQRFPIRDYPEITLQQINVISPLSYSLPVPQNFQLNLPQGVSCDVILSSMVDAGHCFLQQPTHPTYPSLNRLDQFMTATYGSSETPPLPHVDPGVICAVPMMGGWYRGMIVNVELNECNVKFVDYGGYSKISTSYLRQIRYDFMSLPFQATECYLANIDPINGESWSSEAFTFFEELAQGQILQAHTLYFADDGLPCVNLHKIQGTMNTFINQELVENGHAKWIENSV